jgi:hypothetical protein
MSPSLVLAFVLWLGVGFGVWQRRAVVKSRLTGASRAVRVALGFLLLFGGGIALLAGLMGVQSMGNSSTLSANQWVSVALLGSVFVAAQTVAGIVFFSVVEENVTLESTAASIKQEGKDKS